MSHLENEVEEVKRYLSLLNFDEDLQNECEPMVRKYLESSTPPFETTAAVYFHRSREIILHYILKKYPDLTTAEMEKVLTDIAGGRSLDSILSRIAKDRREADSSPSP